MSAGVDGDVRVQYVVDASGHTVPSSFAVVHSTQDLFTLSIRQVFPGWLFAPAQVHGRRVAVRYEEVFSFRALLGLDDDAAFHAVPRDSSYAGLPRTFIPFKPKEFVEAARFSRADVLAAQRRALATLAETADPHGATGADTAMLCVTVRRDTTAVPADAETIRGLNRLGHHAVAASDCRGTHVDVTISKAEGWALDQVRVWAKISRGNSGDFLVCVVDREQRQWSTTCRNTSSYFIAY